jgi:hypothetical protein
MFPEMILIVAGAIAVVTFLYVNEEKIRDRFGIPPRETKVVVVTRDTPVGTFSSANGGPWTTEIDGKDWQAKDTNGEPDPVFVARIPDIRRVLDLWERKVRDEEDGLGDYDLAYVEQGETEDEVDLVFTHREHDDEAIFVATLRAGEIVDRVWVD